MVYDSAEQLQYVEARTRSRCATRVRQDRCGISAVLPTGKWVTHGKVPQRATISGGKSRQGRIRPEYVYREESRTGGSSARVRRIVRSLPAGNGVLVAYGEA